MSSTASPVTGDPSSSSEGTHLESKKETAEQETLEELEAPRPEAITTQEEAEALLRYAKNLVARDILAPIDVTLDELVEHYHYQEHLAKIHEETQYLRALYQGDSPIGRFKVNNLDQYIARIRTLSTQFPEILSSEKLNRENWSQARLEINSAVGWVAAIRLSRSPKK